MEHSSIFTYLSLFYSVAGYYLHSVARCTHGPPSLSHAVSLLFHDVELRFFPTVDLSQLVGGYTGSRKLIS